MNEWYRDFFTGVVVEMWRDAVPPEQTQVEIDFLQRSLQLAAGDQVLDVPCGCGRHALELARLGLRVVAVDVSAEMVAEGQRRQRAAETDSGQALAIDWRIADMRSLDERGTFDAACCLGNSFGYLDRVGTSQFLQAVAGALKPQARFVFDYGLSAESILPRFTEYEWAPVGDVLFLEHNRYDVASSCIETTYKFVHDGIIETRIGHHYVYTVAEIQYLLNSAGLRVLALHGGYQNEPFDLAAPVLCVVAERQ